MKHALLPARLVLLALFTMPCAALAQPETEGRGENLYGDERGDEPIPEAAWEESFQGLHAVEGACEDPDAVWAFGLGTIEMGRTICTSLGKLTWDDGWLHVPGGQCSRMGESVDAIWVALREEGDGVISARIDGSDEVILLEHCPPQAEE